MSEVTSFDDWVAIGLDNGWCSVPLCDTHDGLPLTQEQIDLISDGDDICVHVLRLYDNRQEKIDAEADHTPSHYRNHWSKSDD